MTSKVQVGEVTRGEGRYPVGLEQVKNPPEKLWYVGNWQAKIFKTCLAVVGSRRMSEYGAEMVIRLVSPVARAGVTIVSGFMYGVDAAAHQAALAVGGKTIAVLGCGIELVRPTDHLVLKKQILTGGGLLLSELAGEHPALRWTFIRRNRIVAGLSQAVLVIEAAEKSGALITAKLAKASGRKVLVVPGPVTSQVSVGTNKLIKEGAILVSSPQEILLELGITLVGTANSTSKPKLEKSEQAIWNALEEGKKSTDELARELAMGASEVGAKLSLMVLRGVLREDGRGGYSRRA